MFMFPRRRQKSQVNIGARLHTHIRLYVCTYVSLQKQFFLFFALNMKLRMQRR